jgi:Abortive infection alpha
MIDFPGRKEIVAGVRTVLGPSGRELGELVADRVRFWRWRQLVKIMKRAAEIKKRRRRKQIDVPLKFFLPFVEEASKESDDALVELWANLLASADDGTTGFDILCIDLLKRIGREEAALLLKLDDARSSAPVLSGSVALKLEDIINETRTAKGVSKFAQSKWRDKDMILIEKHLLREKIIPTLLCYKERTITRKMTSEFYRNNVRTILTLEKLGLIAENETKASPQGVEIIYLVLSDLGCEVVRRCAGGRSARRSRSAGEPISG